MQRFIVRCRWNGEISHYRVPKKNGVSHGVLSLNHTTASALTGEDIVRISGYYTATFGVTTLTIVSESQRLVTIKISSEQLRHIFPAALMVLSHITPSETSFINSPNSHNSQKKQCVFSVDGEPGIEAYEQLVRAKLVEDVNCSRGFLGA